MIDERKDILVRRKCLDLFVASHPTAGFVVDSDLTTFSSRPMFYPDDCFSVGSAITITRAARRHALASYCTIAVAIFCLSRSSLSIKRL